MIRKLVRSFIGKFYTNKEDCLFRQDEKMEGETTEVVKHLSFYEGFHEWGKLLIMQATKAINRDDERSVIARLR